MIDASNLVPYNPTHNGKNIRPDGIPHQLPNALLHTTRPDRSLARRGFRFFIENTDLVARHTPLIQRDPISSKTLLHASISCKWTLRSDRSQNVRTEVVNLIRNRKGNLPHVAAVTAEPLPMRIASLALGTGELDCVYHFALCELEEVVIKVSNEDQQEMLATLIEGRRLRDISDLLLDLAI